MDINTKPGMASAVKWLAEFLSHIKDGGAWIIPRSGTVYEIDHGNKVATKTVAMLPDPSLDKVFIAAGWTVK